MKETNFRNYPNYPENHPAKKLFRNLTSRALDRMSITDEDIKHYMTEMLLRFISVENLYSLKDEDGKRLFFLYEMCERAKGEPKVIRTQYYRHIGDHALFILGYFEKSFSQRRRCVFPSDYEFIGRHCYRVASELESNHNATIILRKMENKFNHCVTSLNWIREYTTDEFYQYMLRQWGIM